MRPFNVFFLLFSCVQIILANPFHANRGQVSLQDLVEWDSHSLMVRGERMFLFSGEFHPFRLPAPGLWLDVFQKIKAMGFNCASFYTDWALLEGERGHVITDGIWNLSPFFDAAAEVGIYLIARPGPYINAETAAGGMPGWALRLNSTLRSDAPEYLDATRLYLKTIGEMIAEAQITNGGPVILVQPENEYSTWPNVNKTDFPQPFNRRYMAFVEQQLREAGIVVPFISNDNEGSNGPTGYWAPGTGPGAVDVYGIDAYPMRYDCAHPSIWPTYRFPRNWQLWHEQVSPSTPFAIPEFQGGSGAGWGPDSVNQDLCNALVNEESVRVLFKNNYSFGVKLLNVYMTYGGTNWGNLGYQGGDTSYDYGAAISEDRHVWREKYSEHKLEANFLKVSPAYLTALPGNASNGTFVSTDKLAVTPLVGTERATNLYIVRHADFTSQTNTSYQLMVPTSIGNLTIPRIGRGLQLHGRDSKIHVTDYDVGGVNLIYCTADIFTWTRSENGQRILIMYGGIGENHEFALPSCVGKPRVSGTAHHKALNASWVLSWTVIRTRQIVRFPDIGLDVYLLWRNEAYMHWVLELPQPSPIGNYSSPSKGLVIIKGGYLLRTARIEGEVLSLIGDVNATTDLEIVHEPTEKVKSLCFNGELLDTERNAAGNMHGIAAFQPPALELPHFARTEWKYLDSLPELNSGYDDELWTKCNFGKSNNSLALSTPTNLYASDYGYHTGSLLYRGHFIANGLESQLFLNLSGGSGFGHSVWLNETFLGSWTGDGGNQSCAQSLDISSKLIANQPYVFTVLIDHMGQDEEAPGTDAVKFPRGILDYQLSGHEQPADVTWKTTGNLGGEMYRDRVRGPRNEGALFAERQGYHQPGPPSGSWKSSNPITVGLVNAGVGFYSIKFELNIPLGYDLPLSFVFNNGTYCGKNYRVQLFVNGYQFGKYVNQLGPQTEFPVPEGVLDYNGTNFLAVTLWAQDADGARLGRLELVSRMPVRSGYFDSRRPLSPQPKWKEREGAY